MEIIKGEISQTAANDAADQRQQHDSSMSETTTAPLPKPSARRVAISRVRAATALPFTSPA